MYQVRTLQDAFDAIQDLFDRTENDKTHFDEQLTKAVGLLEEIETEADKADEDEDGPCRYCESVQELARNAIRELQ